MVGVGGTGLGLSHPPALVGTWGHPKPRQRGMPPLDSPSGEALGWALLGYGDDSGLGAGAGEEEAAEHEGGGDELA